MLISFEGIDGSGKTTQARLLAEALGSSAHLTMEPTNSIVGKAIRLILKGHVNLGLNEVQRDKLLAILSAADRLIHQAEIQKALDENKIVICDRYIPSSLAYNATKRHEREFIRLLNHGFIEPDLIIYLDLPVEAAMQRLESRFEKDFYESREKLTAIESGYSVVLAQPDVRPKLRRIDANQPVDAIARLIRAEVDELSAFLEFKDLMGV